MSRHTRTGALPLLLVVACAVVTAIPRGEGRCDSPDSNGLSSSSRLAPIPPDEVNLENLPLFEAQLRRDLPVGTAKEDVEAYLTRWTIRHSFVPPDIGLGDN